MNKPKNKEEWVTAMNEEYNSIMRNKTWDLLELPKDKVSIGSQWLFKSKPQGLHLVNLSHRTCDRGILKNTLNF